MPTGWLSSPGEAAECGSRAIFDVPDLGTMRGGGWMCEGGAHLACGASCHRGGSVHKYQPLAPSFNSKSPWYFLLDNTVIWGDVSSVLHLFNVPTCGGQYQKECHFVARVGLPAFAQILLLARAPTFYSGEER